MSKVFNRSIKLAGQVNADSVNVLAVDKDNKVLLCTGTSVPTGAGFAKGCFFIKTNASTNGNYQNEGDEDTADFQLMTTADIADDAVTTAKILDANVTAAKLASDAVETAKIKNANVTLAKLAAGITPSHVVKYAGKFTTAGGDANEQASVSGVVATDIVIASLQDKGATPRTILTAKAGTNVIDFVMSGDPSTDHVINYMVLRAAA